MANNPVELTACSVAVYRERPCRLETNRGRSSLLRYKTHYMKIKFQNPGPFELICLGIFILFVSISIYFFTISHVLIASVLLFLSFWALSIFLGKLLFASAYLEGHLVRLLIKNGGSMPKNDIRHYYANYSSMDYVIENLKERNAITIEDDIVNLLKENIATGYKNRLMMWGTRRVKL
jgi:hypothetical protein